MPSEKGLKVHGIGVDIEDIGRFRKILGNAPFWEKVYTPREIEYCMRRASPEMHIAARFAGKEAVMKALRNRKGLSYNKIEILNRRDGSPFVNIKDKRMKRRFKFFISLSHSRTKAIAFSVVKEERP